MYSREGFEDIGRRFRVKYIILFGSRVSGSVDAFSDWDFGVRFGRRVCLREYLDMLSALMDVVDSDYVDLVVVDDLFDSNPPLLYSILWEGKPVYIGDEETYHWDRVMASRLYNEYRLLFKPIVRQYLGV